MFFYYLFWFVNLLVVAFAGLCLDLVWAWLLLFGLRLFIALRLLFRVNVLFCGYLWLFGLCCGVMVVGDLCAFQGYGCFVVCYLLAACCVWRDCCVLDLLDGLCFCWFCVVLGLFDLLCVFWVCRLFASGFNYCYL